MKNIIKSILRSFNLALVKHTSYEIYEEAITDYIDLMKLDAKSLNRLIELLPESKSQIRQDLFVLLTLGFKEKGFFIEFGATNGEDLSNTYLLEKNFNWNGILAEPARLWHKDLEQNRNCIIEKKCVWKVSNDRLIFNQTADAELSTISSFSNVDHHKLSRKNGEQYEVDTISLTDLLDNHKAPAIIDYLSIDTEGSEFDILNNFDFDKYQFRVITCEHNKSDARHKINRLLKSKGYKRMYVGFSQFDDWYIKSDLIN